MAVKPKLALIPSGYKAGKVYSVLPSDGSGDFDNFSRSNQTATRVNKDGLIETVGSNVPRLNYPMIDGVVSGCPSLLLEPARTNLVTYSEDFSESIWTKSGSSVVSGFISPDGTASAFKLVEDTSTGSHKIYQNIAGTTANADYSISFYVKPNGNDYVTLNPTGLSASNTQFNLSTKTVAIDNYAGATYSNGKIEELANGWLRCSATVNEPYGAIYAHIYTSPTTSYLSYTGDGTSGLYIWGAQLELGSYPTSYIPTNGSTATRSAETCNGAGDATTFNDSEGVLMAEISALTDIGSNQSIAISDGSINNRILFRYNSTNQIRVIVISNTSFVFDKTLNISSINEYNKFVIKYKQDDFALWVNGFELGADNSGVTPTGLNELALDDGSGVNDFYGNTKQIQYFDTALIDSELETLTSWTSFNEMAISQQYSLY